MCGIVGILELDGATSPSRHVLESMTAAIAHRGPDEHGIWVDGCVGPAARRLLLARDRFGEKPLYYARLPRTFLFASEPKALLMHPRVSRELDWTALARYLTYDYVPAPHAIFRAVRKLPPAHWMAVGVGGAET